MNSKDRILKELVDMTPAEADEVLVHLLTIKRRRTAALVRHPTARTARQDRPVREATTTILRRFDESAELKG